jgi:hypothetical protein
VKRKHTAQFGSISHGTMRSGDLIPVFADELRALRGSLPRDLYNEIRQWERTEYDESAPAQDIHEEYGEQIVEALFDALNEYAPPYGYFGSHPGDGADYGFWLCEDFQTDFDGLQVSDTSEVPRDYVGEVLHVNDHGNCTLYVARKGKLREVWAVV